MGQVMAGPRRRWPHPLGRKRAHFPWTPARWQAQTLASDSPTSLVLASQMVVSALQQPQTKLFTQKDSEPTDLFAPVVVRSPPRTLPPPRPPLPPPAAASSSTKSKTAGSKKAEPHATYARPRNLYLAVYALDVGGSTAEVSEQWKALEQEKLPSALFQAYDKYSKELV
ncbi:hypothetical protein B0H19DRAFT_1233225 [Mycena capillaripes]|nr:hypothetical protein B0H19DRAFT_1233225 [Mycena capillaripes]